MRGRYISARLIVQVKDLSQWNSKLSSIKLYALGPLTYDNFTHLDDSCIGCMWAALGKGALQDAQAKASTLSFAVTVPSVQSKTEIGFSFRANPEDPSGTINDDSNYIFLNNPTLILDS